MKNQIFLIVAVLILSGCGASLMEMKQATLKRAAYDLNCPEKDVELTELEKSDAIELISVKYGAKGCGKQSVYQASDRQGMGRIKVDQAGSLIENSTK